ncbi:DUF4419 domain-containing protein [bacterium]|nr:DUF4419 domain-containing protein [bacterium]
MRAIPNCMTSVPLKVEWGTRETDMRLVGGLLAVSQNAETMTIEPECGWVILYENPIENPSGHHERLAERANRLRQGGE